MNLQGRIWKLGDNIDTDVIIPATYLNSTDPDFLARHCLEPILPGFVDKVRPGDILVAGRNFGGGSSREHAPLALKACRLAAVAAESFARIFFRNAVNIGLPVIEAANLTARVRTGDVIRIDLDGGRIIVLRTGSVVPCLPMADFMRDLMKAGGLMNYQRRRQAAKKRKRL